MEWNLLFFFNSILLGIGLSMDAFSVSLANGLNEPAMKKKKMYGIAAVFAFFQAAMPLIGWVCVHTAVQYFKMFEPLIPWIALALLLLIGGKMIADGLKSQNISTDTAGVSLTALIAQGIATSIDALSVGFTIVEYGPLMAVVCALIIAAVTFLICMAGLIMGRKFGTQLSGKASIGGGAILIIIGLEIFLVGVF